MYVVSVTYFISFSLVLDVTVQNLLLTFAESVWVPSLVRPHLDWSRMFLFHYPHSDSRLSVNKHKHGFISEQAHFSETNEGQKNLSFRCEVGDVSTV